MSMAESDCFQGDHTDRAAAYVAGRLPESDAAAFELHCLGCDRCWSEVRAAAEIREARGLDAVAPAAARPRQSRGELRTVLAAAAALVVLILGARQIAERSGVPASESVWRGESEESLPLQIRSGEAGSIVLRWPAVPDAGAYRVEIFASDGQSVWQRETSKTEATLTEGTLAPTRAGISFFATVEALDSTGQPIARSRRVRVPEP